jgi:hypothetical protein
MTLNLSFDTWALCRIIDSILSESEPPYLGFVVRSDVITHADQRSNMEQTLEYLVSHPSINEMAICTPAEMLAALKPVEQIRKIGD